MTSIGMLRQKRRARLAAVTVAAVLATGAGVAAAAGANASVLPSSSRAAVHTVANAAASGVEVASGQRLAVGGATLWLTPTGLHLVASKFSGSDTPELLRVADVRRGKVMAEARGDVSGTLWAGIYRGPVTASTKVTIKVGARTLDAKVVTLGGKTGWGAYYVFDAGHGVGADKPVITVEG